MPGKGITNPVPPASVCPDTTGRSIVRRSVGLTLLVAAASHFSTVCGAATWTSSVDEKNGLPVVSKGGASAVTSDFVFWQRNWRWAGPATPFKIDGPFQYHVTGESDPLRLRLDDTVQRTSPHQLQWNFDLDAGDTLSDAIGDGLSFQFDLDNLGAEFWEPTRAAS